MHDLIKAATPELARFLAEKLPEISADWWSTHVIARLSFQQQRVAQERGHSSLQQLDFAALLRVLDQNWYDLSNNLNLPREGRSWVKELQTVRNKWAHLSAEVLPPSEIYRDTDTLGRMLEMIGASQDSIAAVEEIKTHAVAAMAKAQGGEDQTTGGKDDTQKRDMPSEPQVDGSVTESNESATKYRVGELVALRSDPSIIVPVIEIIKGGNECRYCVFQNNAKATYYESQLQPLPESSRDDKGLTAAELRARLTATQILSPSTATLFSLHAGRVQFVPYQYRPVLKLIRSDRPRLLIADEVGVGKTIETGLIIKELRARVNLFSILIICPKALVAERKWFLEMKRFDEQFTALDGRTLRHCLKETHLEGEWPEQYSKAILPFSLFDSNLLNGRPGKRSKNEPGLINLDPPPKFDLLIVDEAHHIRNSETFLHQGVRLLCDNAEAVIFLTATPVQLGSNDLYTLLNVLRPDLVIDPTSFALMAEPNAHINRAVHHCRTASDGWQHEARGNLDDAAQTEWGRMFIRESPVFQNIYDRLHGDPIPDVERVALTRETEEMYTFSGLINRTRRRDIGEFTTRRPETLEVEFTPQQLTLHDNLLDVIARIFSFCHGQQNVKFMMTTIRRQAASCLYGLAPLLEGILAGKLDRLESMEASDDDEVIDLSFVDGVRGEIAELIEMVHSLDPKDPKVEAFMKVITEKSKRDNNKVLLFSTFRHTLAYLVRHVERTELRHGLIHGSVPDDDRADLRRRFALPKEDADAIDVLLSSEVGCEGLDFQFCDFLVNYDLPWNPMRIEQRIGRIDRYGQKSETVAIVNLITPGTVDADIYQRCLLRIGVFQHAIGGNEEILGDITREIHDIAENFTLSKEEREERLRQVSDNSIRQIREEQELEMKQADLFGLNIPNATWRDEVDAAQSYWLSPKAIQRCVSSYLSERLGTETEHLLGEKAIKTLRLGQEARAILVKDFKTLPRSTEPVSREWERWLKGAQPTLSVTFDQQAANENQMASHLWVLHPLVRQSANFQKLTEPAFVNLVASCSEIRNGEYRFALYQWRNQGVKIDETLVPVASEPSIESRLLALLQNAEDVLNADAPARSEFDKLDARHHEKWTSAHANHIAENERHVEHRMQSLKVSHLARCKAIEDQIGRATNDKIVIMKQSELARANADYDRRTAELKKQASSGDIHATPLVFGIITIEGGIE